MQRAIILTAIAGLFLLMSYSCDKDCEHEVPDISIYNSWVRQITDSQNQTFNGELMIRPDNSLNFIVLDSNTNHTNSYAEFTINHDTLKFIIDNDCNVEGIYEFLVTENKISFITVNDPCGPRAEIIQGIWNKK